MPEIYVKLILLGKKSINDVPEHLQEEVQKRLDELAGERSEVN